MGGRLLGELEVSSDDASLSVDAMTLGRMRLLVNGLAPFLDVALHHNAVARDAQTDGLTQLANHRAFYRTLERELVIREAASPVRASTRHQVA